MTAPIILFVYNRPNHTLKTLNALKNNTLANQSSLYIFCDGPKKNATNEELDSINEVRRLAKSEQWCKNVTIIEAEYNKGLATSIIEGVTNIVNKYGKVIVLEDDIVTSIGFLKYMNDALDLYQDEEKVMHISGYMYPIKAISKKTVFLKMLSCWGWGTWHRAWINYCDDAKYFLDKFESNETINNFNLGGNADFYEQLQANANGVIRTWAVKWYASWYFLGGYSLCPSKSLTNNIGHDGSGTHCYNQDKFNTLPIKELKFKKLKVKEDLVLKNKINKYLGKPQKSILFQVKENIRKLTANIIYKIVPELKFVTEYKQLLSYLLPSQVNCVTGKFVKIHEPACIFDVKIDDYSYISPNSNISLTSIGKFCSIGPNFFCGWGVHPLNGISTSPMFYSLRKQNGITFSKIDKIEERIPIEIGNDVFIGMNVTVLDGVNIGNGAVIAAGSVVTTDVPDYAVVGGVPAKIIKYRFDEDTIQKLLKIEWWKWEHKRLEEIETDFYNIQKFINQQLD